VVAVNLLLMSNGLAPGFSYLEHAAPALGDLLAGLDRVAFVPYAQRLLDHHTATVAAAMEPFGVEVVGVHQGRSPRKVVESAQAIFVGGGNAFRLCAALYEYDLMGAIRTAVRDGVPYIGSSAGTNVACPSIRTTNDMPIAEPPSFRGLGLIPFHSARRRSDTLAPERKRSLGSTAQVLSVPPRSRPAWRPRMAMPPERIRCR
jgi:dipeptidase E